MQYSYPIAAITPTQFELINEWNFKDSDNDYKYLEGGSIETSGGTKLYSNLYSIGSTETGTQYYIIQNDVELEPWWITGDVDFSGKVQTSIVDIICTLNLDKIYDTDSRNDEEALQTIIKIIHNTHGWEINKVRKGNVKNVFNFMDTKDITYRDMQPYANFAISCKVNYLNNICKL